VPSAPVVVPSGTQVTSAATHPTRCAVAWPALPPRRRSFESCSHWCSAQRGWCSGQCGGALHPAECVAAGTVEQVVNAGYARPDGRSFSVVIALVTVLADRPVTARVVRVATAVFRNRYRAVFAAGAARLIRHRLRGRIERFMLNGPGGSRADIGVPRSSEIQKTE
jgi:hypothetical protein